jgi:hypothetical protein
MSFRISGQVPFEDVKQLEADAETRAAEDIGDKDFNQAVLVWALERYGRHLKSCVGPRSVGLKESAGLKDCTCGLQWAFGQASK